jgi:Predicted membrane protein
MNIALLLALGIGIVAGLRSLTAPAVVSWAATAGWLNLHGSPLAFMGSKIAAVILSLLAIGELIADKLPTTPKRTALAGLLARIVMGGLSGACLCASVHQSLVAGALPGAAGAVAGAFGAYQIRKNLVSNLNIKDTFVAVAEDLVAIGFACFLVCVAR